MPTKGFFSQGVAILLTESVSLDEIQPLLGEIKSKRKDPSGTPLLGGPALVVEFRPDVNGFLLIDVIDRPWPDTMGDPKNDPELFAAWSMGNFGPQAYPGGLQRAADHGWNNPASQRIVPKHNAFIRLRITYLLGAAPDTKVVPPDYNAEEELRFLDDVVLLLLAHPKAVAYFNPNGEVLAEREPFKRSIDFHQEHSLPPLDLWTNIRLFNIDPTWLLMDTVGMEQLDLPDHEACFPKDRFEPSEVDNFLRNASLYLMQNGEVIEDKNTMDGPGQIRWFARHVKDPVGQPPRRVLRWFPSDQPAIPEKLLPKEQKPASLVRSIRNLFRR